jgi:hypothetical protein
MAELLRMLPRDESIEDKFKTLLNNDPLGATVRTFLSHVEAQEGA